MNNITILFSALKYDYGVASRGESLEKKAFLPALQKNAEKVYEFWLEDHGYLNDLSALQKALVDYAEQIKPDVIFFILFENEFTLDTLDILRKKYITINWFCDDQWRFHSFTKVVAPHFTFPITVDKYSLCDYKKIGCENVMLAQWACVEYENIDLEKSISYKYDVSFVGSYNPARAWIVNELRKNGINVVCFGAGWSEGRISYSEMKEIFLKTKINLNLSNSLPLDIGFRLSVLKHLFYLPYSRKSLKKYKQNIIALKYLLFTSKRVEQIKARNFEIPGYGGFILSQFALSIEDYYVIGKEISVFSNVEELQRQIEYYLNNEEIRERMKREAYIKTKGYTYDNYLKTILEQAFLLIAKS